MDQVDAQVHDLEVLVTKIAGGDETKRDFAHMCAEVEIWQAIEEAIRTKGSRARQLRNALLPIHRVPPELILEVLRSVIEPFAKQEDYYIVVKRISGVCHLWRHIINGAPALWSRIHGWDPPPAMDEALERSAAHTLDVWFDPGCGMNEIDMDTFLEKLSPHMDRCEKLVLVAGWQEGGLEKLVALPAPQLQRVVLKDSIWGSDFTGVELFAGNATCLKEIELVGVSCNWESTVFRDLSSLSITGVQFPSFDHIHSVLHHSINLLQLELHSISFHGDTNPTYADSIVRPINLPVLRKLSLGFNDIRRTEAFLNRLQAPVCTRLLFSVPDTPDIQGKIAQFAAVWLSQLQGPKLHPRSINIAMAPRKTTLSTVGRDGQSSVSLILTHSLNRDNSASVLDGVNHVATHYLAASESHLQLDHDILDFLDHQNIHNELHRLPPVTQIEIGDPSSEPGPTPNWALERRWTFPPFPSLQSLRFFNSRTETILAIVNAVFDNPTPDAEKRVIHMEVHAPSVFAVDDLKNALATEIQAIIGEDNRLSFIFTPHVDRFRN